MRVIESWEIEGNFWNLNPQFLVPEVFRKLYDEDKSKDKAQSSKILWALALYSDFDSKYRQLHQDQRKELISRDYLKDPKFKWKDYKSQIQGWDLFKTVPQKQMEQWERIMNEKKEFLDTLPFNEQNCRLIEELMLSTEKLNKTYDALMEKLAQEGNGGVVLGGGLESMMEKDN